MRKKSAKRSPPKAAPRSSVLAWGLFSLGVMVLIAVAVFFQGGGSRTKRAAKGPVTFHRDVAPIIYNNCSPCHHPGQAAPFNLLGYADVQKRARQIRDVVEQRIMPPWLPDASDGPFVGQRTLNPEQISIISRWVEQGTPEGSVNDAPALPRWTEGWQLGPPDLVIQMPEPFSLAADGPDIYRNFIIPITNSTRRFVKGIELQPRNPRIVHHAFMRIDPTRESRKRDEQEQGPGFSGLHTPTTAQTPQGQFLSWQPGKMHTFVPRGLAWTLETNCDLVLQMHLRPSGKPEAIQAEIGFYFTDEAPTNAPFKVGLFNYAIDIPAGASAHEVRDTYTLAADVKVLSVLPHAHYLGKELSALATLPDGKQQPLLHIANWDFNWQGEYLFEKPVFLPRGTTLSMIWRYDNSTNNPRNPHNPPQRVQYGLQSNDEMGELWMQVLPVRKEEIDTLAQYDQPRVFKAAIDYNQYVIARDPNNARAHNELGKAQLFLGRYSDAHATLSKTTALDPRFDEPHYFLGVLYRMHNRLADAATEFTAAVQRNPENARAHGSLGIVLMAQGDLEKAESHLRIALRLNPQDQIAKESLERLATFRARK